MDYFVAILKIIGLVLFVLVAGAFVFFFFMWFMGALAAMVALFAVAWAVGIPITIKENGVKVGYLRWTKFYRTPGK
jgi:hypothetical protein